MLYQPSCVKEMWDTWMYYRDGVHYLFTLHRAESSNWDGISLATSADGVRFEDQGIVLSKPEGAAWLGSGAVWPYEKGYVMNYSLEIGGTQRICFAVSPDLRTWEPLEPAGDFYPDKTLYRDTQDGRWDCIWPVPRAEGGYYGFFTANPLCADPLDLPSVGCAESTDGIHWRAAAPPEFQWDGPPIKVGEVGAVEKLDGAYYMLVGMNELEPGMRGYGRADLGDMGMYVFRADRLMGPYRLQPQNPRLLVSKAYPDWIAQYFTRFYRLSDSGETLLCHQSLDRVSKGDHRFWLAPLKKAVVLDGVLWMGWWPANDKLMGERIYQGFGGSRPVWPGIDRGWRLERERFVGREPRHGGQLEFGGSFDLERGIVLTADIRIEDDEENTGGAGFYFGCEGVCEYVLIRREATEVGKLWREKYMITELCAPHPLRRKTWSVKLLVRHNMLECYADGVFLQSHSFHSRPTGALGLLFEACTVSVENLCVWRWKE